MKVVSTIQSLRTEISKYKQSNKSIGFVPTMGFLHEGHLRLLEVARKENDIVVLSIFVNPLQFGPNEDYDSYPRNIERDVELAAKAEADVVFAPDVKEMYPNKPSYSITVKSRTDVLCGRSREGHFDGVATVLTKLFHLVEPTRAYFGMKDAQQVAVIEGLVNELHFPVKLVSVETVREEDGLAKSSRNVKLDQRERKQAPVIYQSLMLAKERIMQGDRNKDKIISDIALMIERETDGHIDYVELLSYPELKDIDEIIGKIIIAVAVKFTNARLIDNITLTVG